MPEVQPEKNLEMYRQCEIRRPSSPAIITVGDVLLTKPPGYYFDIVWIKIASARIGVTLTDESGNNWTVHETFGAQLKARGRTTYREQ